MGHPGHLPAGAVKAGPPSAEDLGMIARAVAWATSNDGRKVVRYLTVSVLSVGASQMALVAAFAGLGWAAQPANYLSFVVGGIVSYWLNRAWVWGMTDPSGMAREVVLFLVVAFVGLAASTWAVGIAEQAAARLAMTRGPETAFVASASLAAFGIVAIGKFIVMNRWVFVHRDAAPQAVDA